MDINSDCFGFNVKGNKTKKIKIEKNQIVEKEGDDYLLNAGEQNYEILTSFSSLFNEIDLN